MGYTINTARRRVIYSRPANKPAGRAGSATGLDVGTLAYDRAPPIELAYIVHYPDASGTTDPITGRTDYQVVTVSRAVPTISKADVVRTYATRAEFEAAVLLPLGIGPTRLDPTAPGSLAALAPAKPIDGSLLRWQRTELAAGET